MLIEALQTTDAMNLATCLAICVSDVADATTACISKSTKHVCYLPDTDNLPCLDRVHLTDESVLEPEQSPVYRPWPRGVSEGTDGKSEI